MPGILTPPQRVSRLYSHTFAAENSRRRHRRHRCWRRGRRGRSPVRPLSLAALPFILPHTSTLMASNKVGERELFIHLFFFHIANISAADGGQVEE